MIPQPGILILFELGYSIRVLMIPQPGILILFELGYSIRVLMIPQPGMSNVIVKPNLQS